MRISALAERSGLPVATLKFYLRKGLLPPGRALSRTQADYDEDHLARVRLIRALTEVGELSLETVGRVLATLDDPGTERLGVLAAAQRALTAPDEPGTPCLGQGGEEPAPSRARAWLRERGWRVHAADPLIAQLDRAWDACDLGQVGLDSERMDAYADAAERIATIDVASVPAAPDLAVRQVVTGTLLVDPVLRTLRRLAQQHLSVLSSTSSTGSEQDRGPCDP
ncbi:MerR family transcriptional regulator [Kocuria coralli]|uniref:MerR family transcriptional regulator n=1 Tax=Kocuria coralli TaxID=1461025 RepID=A0A5J5L2B0_9MICC|nr:MerR family transcriptional regulator [Kocuria coralli]KAA9395345.1 MerR family transcriptional regulator [Kocuria coralli]